MRFQYCEIPGRKTKLWCRDSSELANSVSLETKVRLLIGWRLGKLASDFGFLSLGQTSACSQLSGKHPDSRERLILFVSAGNRTQRHSKTI